MHTLFSETEFKQVKSDQKLPLKCDWCSETFHIQKKYIKQVLTADDQKRKNAWQFCSTECAHASRNQTFGETCINCTTIVFRQPSQKRKSKSGNIFCSRSCAAKYNNTHKTKGNRRSKMEQWLEKQLVILYPNLNFKFNEKETINSELDIYIPSLKLAFELNGIFHYEPIFGEDKLASIKNNDERKFQACLELEIEFVIIDSSNLKYFKESNAIKYLAIISKIIDNKLVGRAGVEPACPLKGAEFSSEHLLS